MKIKFVNLKARFLVQLQPLLLFLRMYAGHAQSHVKKGHVPYYGHMTDMPAY
jgi:hypothetical protein